VAAQGTALVIEDDDDIRHLLEVVLRQNGFDVEYAATGRDGVTAVLAGNFDLITVDLGLPDIDGVDVVREIRTRAQGKIVVISARAMEKYRTLSLEAGADAFVTKPFRPRELRATLTEILAA
jgi:DNA-binding response OmpR family regulator